MNGILKRLDVPKSFELIESEPDSDIYESVWIKVGGKLDVNIHRIGDGVIVDIYKIGQKSSFPIATTHAHFDEANHA